MPIPSVFDPKAFYSRQTVLAELGTKGQRKLKHSKAVVVGLGGLGTVTALYLALAGVGHIRLIDQDTVELNNLHRQILYSLNDMHYPKVEAGAGRIRQVNPEVKVEAIPENIRESNVDKLLSGFDCIVDGLDNMQTRYLVNRTSVKQGIPYVFGAAIGIEGNLSVFSPPETPCLECVLPNLDDRHLPTCDTRGVLGATTGIIGSLQAMETIKLLGGIGGSLKGKLLVCDFKDMYFGTIDIFKRPDCPICGRDQRVRPTKPKEKTLVLCGSDTINVNPEEPMSRNLNELLPLVRNHYQIIIKSSFVIVFKYHGNVEVSLFNGGRMLIKNVKDEKTALQIQKSVLRTLGEKA
jgi:molybdopterin/thiamine biosynthesis adenylyltransferase